MRLKLFGTITVIDPAWNSSAPLGRESTLSTTRQSLSLQQTCGYHEWASARARSPIALRNKGTAIASAAATPTFDIIMVDLAAKRPILHAKLGLARPGLFA